MSVRSADTAGERGRVVSALLASYQEPSSPPWSSTRDRRSSDRSKSNPRSYRTDREDQHRRLQCHDRHRNEGRQESDTDRSTTTAAHGSLVGGADQIHTWDSSKPESTNIDLCASTWRSVENMARMLAAGDSVVSTISKCYSLPELGNISGGRRARRSNRGGRTHVLHTSLVPERLAAEALAVFRRLGQAQTTQPGTLYINSSKLPEAAKALDPGLNDAAIQSWMGTNGFAQHDHNPRQKKERPSSSVEALSWTEYRRALSELCPAFRRHGISTCVSNKYVATTTSGRLCPEQRRTRSPSCNDRIYPAAEQCGRCREAVTEEAGMVPKLYSKEDCVDSSFRARLGRENPPRSPGADSFNVLRRKRHAAVSMDYEAATMEPPQVMPPLDPCILVDHIKHKSRREREYPCSDREGPSLWTLDPHERLLKMSLQKTRISEAANPRTLDPRAAAVKNRSRRNDFTRWREAQAKLISRLSRNAGVICRYAKIAEATSRRKERRDNDCHRVESQRASERRRTILVRQGAEQRARQKRLEMESLKSSIAHQLRAIQQNEARALGRVRSRRHVLQKAEGLDTASLGRVRSCPTLGQSQVSVVQISREPILTPTIPPPDHDARWRYCGGHCSTMSPATSAEGISHVSPSTHTLLKIPQHMDPQFTTVARAPAHAPITVPQQLVQTGSTPSALGKGASIREDTRDGLRGDHEETGRIATGVMGTTASHGKVSMHMTEKRQQDHGTNLHRHDDVNVALSNDTVQRIRDEVAHPLFRAGSTYGNEGVVCSATSGVLRNHGLAASGDRKGPGTRRYHARGDGDGGRTSDHVTVSGRSPSLSPWSRQVASPAGWDRLDGDTFADEYCDAEGGESVRWADETWGSS